MYFELKHYSQCTQLYMYMYNCILCVLSLQCSWCQYGLSQIVNILEDIRTAQSKVTSTGETITYIY